MKPSQLTDADERVQKGLAILPSLRERKQHAAREAIWDAATGLFAQKGYDETTVDEIAQAAGISPRSFFRYFASKGDLMAHGMLAYGSQLVAAIDSCPITWSLREVFRETVFQVLQQAAAQPRTRELLEILKRSPAAAAAEMSRFAEVQAHVARAFARRLPSGKESALTAAVMAGVTLQVAGITVRWCFEQKESNLAATVDRAIAALESLFCAHPVPLGKSLRKR